MTVAELIKQLQSLPQDAKVQIWEEYDFVWLSDDTNIEYVESEKAVRIG